MKVFIAIAILCLAFFSNSELNAQIKPQPEVLEMEPNENYLELAAMEQQKAGARFTAARLVPVLTTLIAGGLYLGAGDESEGGNTFKTIAYGTAGVGLTIGFFLDLSAGASLQKSGDYLRLHSKI